MPKNRFEELLSRLLDDDISDAEIAELVECISADPDRLQQLRDHLQISDRLSQYEDELRDQERFLSSLQVRAHAAEDSEGFVNQVVASAVHEEQIEHRERQAGTTLKSLRDWYRFRTMTGWIIATTVSLLLFAVLARQEGLQNRNESPLLIDRESTSDPTDMDDGGVAVLTRVAGLSGVETEDWQIGETIPPRSMAWEAGLLQLEFYCGATVVVEGPADIEIVDESRVICRKGRLRAHVPKPARGFSVLAPSFELVDLGTEFGLDVSGDGLAEVHVFDGKVELYDAESNRNQTTLRELNAGDALAVDSNGTSASIAVRDADFVSPDRLSTLTDARQRERLQNWQAFRNSLQDDPRVIAYFPFDRNVQADRLLIGHGPEDTKVEGAIVGCEWAEGRWPGKTSLQFKRPGDRVRITIPGEFESLTYSTWIRIDGLDRLSNSLVLADGFSVNQPHWQIRQSGSLVLGVRYGKGESHSYRTESIFNLFRLGQWVHLATVYDAENSHVLHYVNGEVATREPLKSPPTGLLSIGNATIGNWSAPTSRHRRTSVRNLNGCMDELIIFGQAIDRDEVRRIYELGRP
ncbi:FecR protein [Thalassoglobus neptunius]|uniref:FecR protein n=1 Tax=Thalassoglobus neptunius TaxID=1938619 RepID=A0A5C5X612_9PLAN|nr:LamG-like jellyroll fold domain-containing protein [Thalassoglobus neptunius]TWT58079.1 FecR protein [Thalassoglobus neptunius]